MMIALDGSLVDRRMITSHVLPFRDVIALLVPRISSFHKQHAHEPPDFYRYNDSTVIAFVQRLVDHQLAVYLLGHKPMDVDYLLQILEHASDVQSSRMICRILSHSACAVVQVQIKHALAA